MKILATMARGIGLPTSIKEGKALLYYSFLSPPPSRPLLTFPLHLPSSSPATFMTLAVLFCFLFP
jgi:hypothetical protein